MLRFSTADAAGKAVAENGAVYRAYARHWQSIDGVAQGCHYENEGELSLVADSLTPDPNDSVMSQ